MVSMVCGRQTVTRERFFSRRDWMIVIDTAAAAGGAAAASDSCTYQKNAELSCLSSENHSLRFFSCPVRAGACTI
jgi:hypothetical protein